MAHIIHMKNGEHEVFDETTEGFGELVKKYMGDDAEKWFEEYTEEYSTTRIEYDKLVDKVEQVREFLR